MLCTPEWAEGVCAHLQGPRGVSGRVRMQAPPTSVCNEPVYKAGQCGAPSDGGELRPGVLVDDEEPPS